VFLLSNEPFQKFLFLGEVALINMRNSPFEIDQRRQLIDAIFLRFLVVVNLHEGDVVFVAIVIDVFELFKNLLAGFLILVIYKIQKVSSIVF